MAETKRPGPGRPSKIEPFIDQLGKVPDSEIAAKAGVSVNAVQQYRKRHGIGAAGADASAPKGPRMTTKAKPAAKTKGTPKVKQPKASKPKGAGRGQAAALLDQHRNIVGVLSDADVAKQLGISDETVRMYRNKHGIPSASGRGKAAKPNTPKAASTRKAAARKAAAEPAPAAAAAPPKAARAVRPKAVPTTSTCWRVALANGAEAICVIAGTVADAAAKVQAALGDRAVVGVERVGPALA